MGQRFDAMDLHKSINQALLTLIILSLVRIIHDNMLYFRARVSISARSVFVLRSWNEQRKMVSTMFGVKSSKFIIVRPETCENALMNLQLFHICCFYDLIFVCMYLCIFVGCKVDHTNINQSKGPTICFKGKVYTETNNNEKTKRTLFIVRSFVLSKWKCVFRRTKTVRHGGVMLTNCRRSKCI